MDVLLEKFVALGPDENERERNGMSQGCHFLFQWYRPFFNKDIIGIIVKILKNKILWVSLWHVMPGAAAAAAAAGTL